MDFLDDVFSLIGMIVLCVVMCLCPPLGLIYLLAKDRYEINHPYRNVKRRG